MPTSDLSLIESVLGPIVYLDPQSILDIGPGFGKYGFLAREFLEPWGGDASNLERGNWKRRIEGIEVFPKYLTPVHDFIYNKIHVGNASEIMPTLDGPFDLIIIIGVLEHFDHNDGEAVLQHCLRIGRNTLIAVPKNLGDQGEAFGNPYERHKADWRKKHFDALGPTCCVPNEDSLVVCIGPDAPALKRTLRYVSFRRSIRLHVPWLRVFYRRWRKRGSILPGALRHLHGAE